MAQAPFYTGRSEPLPAPQPESFSSLALRRRPFRGVSPGLFRALPAPLRRLRDVIPEVVGKFLECGDLEKGFARVRYRECRHEFLVAFSCKYSNKARGVRAKTGAAQAEDSAQGHEPDRAPTSAQWRRLIAKIWEADPLTCPDCGAEMRILAFIEEDRVIGRILRHLGLLPDASRGPPLQEPVYEPIYNDLPAVEEEDVVYQPF